MIENLITEIDILEITHREWNKLSDDKKIKLIRDTMKKEHLI